MVEMTTQPVPFALQKQDGRASVSTLENVLNLYLEPQPESAESPFALITTPGSRPYAEIPDANGILGAIEVRRKTYIVTARALWTVQENGFAKLADHTIYGRVIMATNGDDILYVDGYGVWGYTISTGSIQKIDIPPATACFFQDGYFAVNRKDTKTWAVSNLNSLVFDPLQFADAEGSPGFILSLLSDHREAWIFKEDATEVWYNSGEDFPFTRIQGAFIEKGIASPYARTKADNTVYWLGSDNIVYRATGYDPQPISTNAIEEVLENADLSTAFMTTYTQEGHIFIWLTVPSIPVTLVYDTRTGLWQPRDTKGLGRHLANVLVRHEGQTLVGDYRNGKIYRFDLDYPFDEDQIITRVGVLPPIFGDGNRMKNGVFELKYQNFSNDLVEPFVTVTGVWTADTMCVTADETEPTADGFDPDLNKCCPGLPQPSQEPLIGLRCTDNQGKTWTPYNYRPYAVKGKQELRARWWKLGTFYERTYQFRLQVPFSGVFVGAYIG